MLQSMTAFGQSVSNDALGEHKWEIRSLNHRHLDVSIRLPPPLRDIENAVKAKLSLLVHRGKLEVSLKLATASEASRRLVVDRQLLEQLLDAIAQVNALPISTGKCDPVSLLQWPGMTTIDATADDKLVKLVLESFDTALEDFLQARKREGVQINNMLSSRADQLAVSIEQLRKQRPSVVQRQREKLMLKLNQLEVEHDTARLEEELVYIAQRLDIDEELDRLQSHLQELSLVLARDEPVGRRLDFLMQEFNREANTVASKSSDSETTRASINMKVLIEQMREQIQNVE